MEKEFNIAEIDWKSESEDVLYAVREIYQTIYPELLQKNFDELTENYAAETTEDFINALGQELSVLNLLLYEVNSDSDSYALVIIPVEDEEEFKKTLKQQKKRGILKKQPRRKLGSNAKRIDLAKRLPCEKFSLSDGYTTSLVPECFDDILWLDYMQFGAERKFDSASLNIGFWPPAQGPDLGLRVRRFAKNEDGTYVAITQNNTVNEQGYLSDKNKKVLIGKDINDIKNWRCVYEGEHLDWSAVIWFENELFVSGKNSVYHIKNPDRFAASMEKVLELDGGHVRLFPKFFVLGNTLYLYLHHSIYKWEKIRSLFKRGFQFRKVYIPEGFMIEDIIPVGDHKVAFQTRPEYIPGGVTEAELTVLDINTLQTEKYPCHYGYVMKWTENRICVLPQNVTGKMPIIECFDFDSNEKRCLMYGALGKDCICDIYETKCGTVLSTRRTLYKAVDLWNYMKV